ncbi:glycolate oxidase FAD binding subunit [Thalassobacillus cyri]|uniref:Glycolate oxidase FAD binding subunit n=1 Tax=Thalassobacillus cyri TaxID=571932 RepID=A0A1H3YSZ2_9BACI|nr:FAD-binding oxidoreductase [Thalassobacillus cyri]SEA14291.1 glycolate oxidase FAD binding subunit [Thalassobacillus cyri]
MEIQDMPQASTAASSIFKDEKFGNDGAEVVAPESEADIADILRKANKDGKKVAIISGGTKRGYGGLKNDYDILLSLSQYKGVVEHTAGDMTVTVRPGTTIKELQDFLREFDQMASIDPAWPEQATIGGVIAANESGPKRMKYGSARDLVIGLRVVYPDGTVIRTGGKVVKNVAGYDMNKLFIGSMGTLGVITEITMKLRPLPKCESLVKLFVSKEQLQDLKTFVVKIQDSMIEPATLEMVNPALSKKLFNRDTYTLLAAFEDVENSVRYQEQWIKDNKPEGMAMDVSSETEATAFWNAFSKIAPNSLTDYESNRTRAVVKIGSKNMNVFEWLAEAETLQKANLLTIEMHGGLGHGITNAICTGVESEVKQAIVRLRYRAEDKKGYAIVKHLPYTLRHEIDVWGHKPAYFFLFEGIKKKNDPNNTLNHQRFVGGI